jgi:uncharacterized low-complexity protein
MKTLMTSMLLAGTVLMAQTTPAPSSNSPAPAKVKKHHHKSKKSATPAAKPATATPAK